MTVRPKVSGDFEITEALDDLSFGEEVQANADKSVAFDSLLFWFLDNYWELLWACGERAVKTLDLEMLWSAVHNPQRVTPLGAGKWWQSRAQCLQEPLGWYCTYD